MEEWGNLLGSKFPRGPVFMFPENSVDQSNRYFNVRSYMFFSRKPRKWSSSKGFLNLGNLGYQIFLSSFVFQKKTLSIKKGIAMLKHSFWYIKYFKFILMAKQIYQFDYRISKTAGRITKISRKYRKIYKKLFFNSFLFCFVLFFCFNFRRRQFLVSYELISYKKLLSQRRDNYVLSIFIKFFYLDLLKQVKFIIDQFIERRRAKQLFKFEKFQ